MLSDIALGFLKRQQSEGERERKEKSERNKSLLSGSVDFLKQSLPGMRDDARQIAFQNLQRLMMTDPSDPKMDEKKLRKHITDNMSFLWEGVAPGQEPTQTMQGTLQAPAGMQGQMATDIGTDMSVPGTQGQGPLQGGGVTRSVQTPRPAAGLPLDISQTFQPLAPPQDYRVPVYPTTVEKRRMKQDENTFDTDEEIRKALAVAAATKQIKPTEPYAIQGGYRINQETGEYEKLPGAATSDYHEPYSIQGGYKLNQQTGQFEKLPDAADPSNPVGIVREFLDRSKMTPEQQAAFDKYQNEDANRKKTATNITIGGLAGPVNTTVQRLATEFTKMPMVTQYNEMAQRAASVNSILNNKWSGPGDMAMIFEFMRALDPTSVVRESEYAAAAKTGNIFSGTMARFNGLMNPSGGFLSDQVKRDFNNVIQNKMKSATAQLKNVYDDYGRKIDMATGQKGTGTSYLTDFTHMLPSIPPPVSSGKMIPLTGPDGKPYSVPEENLQKALERGYKRR
jgi:hypothetical protein